MTTSELIKSIPFDATALINLRADLENGGVFSTPINKGTKFKVIASKTASHNPEILLLITDIVRQSGTKKTRVALEGSNIRNTIEAIPSTGQASVPIDSAIQITSAPAKASSQPTETTDLTKIPKGVIKGIRAIQIAGVIGLGAGLGFAYYRKSKVWGYIGWGILGSIILSGVSSIFVGGKAISDLKKDEDKQSGSTPTPTKVEYGIYNNAVALGRKMGNKGVQPTIDEFLKRYRTFNAKEQSIFNKYMTMAMKVDYTDIEKAFKESAQISNHLISQYGEEAVRKVLA